MSKHRDSNNLIKHDTNILKLHILHNITTWYHTLMVGAAASTDTDNGTSQPEVNTAASVTMPCTGQGGTCTQ
jgi:hypothetical protein